MGCSTAVGSWDWERWLPPRSHAGVIGRRKFSYDLWGDAVNTASRMESHGLPGAIHVSPTTYEKLKDGFAFQSRGTIVVKGKGEMMTWLLRPEGAVAGQ